MRETEHVASEAIDLNSTRGLLYLIMTLNKGEVVLARRARAISSKSKSPVTQSDIFTRCSSSPVFRVTRRCAIKIWIVQIAQALTSAGIPQLRQAAHGSVSVKNLRKALPLAVACQSCQIHGGPSGRRIGPARRSHASSCARNGIRAPVVEIVGRRFRW